MNPDRSRRTLAVLSIVFLLLLITVGIAQVYARGQSTQEGPTVEPNAVAATAPNCRYGIATRNDTLSWLSTFGAGWHLNFGPSAPAVPDADYIGMISVHQDKNGYDYLQSYTVKPSMENGDLEAVILNNPGGSWIVGNEVDVPFVQGDTYPDVYARAYHEVYEYIKAVDPTAQVGPAGLSMATPARLQYWDIVWETYYDEYKTPLPADIWNTHLYILSEKRMADGGHADGKIALGTDPALAKLDALGNAANCPREDVYCRAEHDDLSIFIKQMTDMRQWMKVHGYQDVPLLLTEWGILYPYVLDADTGTYYLTDEEGNPFPPSRVNAYMEATINWMENATDPALGYPHDNYRLVQQWLWYSMWVPAEASGGSSNLLKPDFANYTPGALGALTEVGNNYLDEIQSRPTYVNLAATQAFPAVEETGSSSTVTATLTVEFRNKGNTRIATPFDVTFYSNSGLTNPIGTANVALEVKGCARFAQTASVSWSNLGPGLHRYWARVDAGQVIGESSETDNVISGLVFVDGSQLNLPVINRAAP